MRLTWHHPHIAKRRVPGSDDELSYSMDSDILKRSLWDVGRRLIQVEDLTQAKLTDEELHRIDTVVDGSGENVRISILETIGAFFINLFTCGSHNHKIIKVVEYIAEQMVERKVKAVTDGKIMKIIRSHVKTVQTKTKEAVEGVLKKFTELHVGRVQDQQEVDHSDVL